MRNAKQGNDLISLFREFKARVKRRTSHEPNRMQMKLNEKNPLFSLVSIRFGSCEVRRLTPAKENHDGNGYGNVAVSQV